MDISIYKEADLNFQIETKSILKYTLYVCRYDHYEDIYHISYIYNIHMFTNQNNVYIYICVQKLTRPPEDNELQTSFENPQKVYQDQPDWLSKYMY